MREQDSKFLQMIGVLARQKVDFIVVGGFAAILEGVPIVTADLDVIINRDPGNIPRLLSALEELHAHYLDPAGRYIVPDAYKLESMRMHLLKTDLGRLDLLTKICGDTTYSDLADETHVQELEGFMVRSLKLEMIIAAKEYANRPKDRDVLPRLRGFLESIKASSSD